MRVDAAIQERRRLASLTHEALASCAVTARDAVHCRWGPADLVYDGSIHHTILPELARRVAALTDEPPLSE